MDILQCLGAGDSSEKLKGSRPLNSAKAILASYHFVESM
jgi:hypothetical protein